MSRLESINIIIIITVFGLVFSIWCICVFLWLGKYLIRLKAIQERLGIIRKESGETKTLRLWREVQEESETTTAFGEEKLSLKERLEAFRKDVGWHVPVPMVFLSVFGIVILAFLITFLLTGSWLICLGISLVVILVFSSHTSRKLRKREELFERQLLDALGIAARALRAGHPLVGAFQLVSEEISDPLGGLFYRICKEQELGVDLKDSIYKVARLSRNSEMKLLATAVVIQFQSGGNFADLMDTLSSVIRARVNLNRRVRVITAQTQMSKRILLGLPIFLFFFLNMLNPLYMEPLYTTQKGKTMLVVMVICMLIGSWIMKKMSVIRF
ncbi:MAG: type II secretion system F family protein [Planctomycetota bacterium]|jgi:tight adherence protein B